MKAPWFRPEGQLLAEHGGELVGLSAVQLFLEKHSACNLVTGVLPAFRQRGIAKALKLEAVRYARRSGASYIRADNDLTNHAMIAINRRFGYVPEPGRILMERTCRTSN